VWLDRPDRLNALDDTALTELRETFEALDDDETVRAAVVAATGPVFSAGFDVRWMSGLDTETVAEEQEGIRAVYDTIEAFTKPLVAAIHAPAMGGGLLLALVSDIRLASEGAGFGAPEVKIGIFPSLDLVPRLEWVVGRGMAKRMVLTGDPISAAEAERAGLVEPLVPADELIETAAAMAGGLAALPPMGVRAAKEAFAAWRRPGYAEWEIETFTECWASSDRSAAMGAFLRPD
jgi:enoyl-CoA hydratase